MHRLVRYFFSFLSVIPVDLTKDILNSIDKVQKLFNEFIMLRLYTDGGENHRENQQLEITRFGTAALPFYVVLSPDDEEISRFPGMDPDVNKFVSFLEKSLN